MPLQGLAARGFRLISLGVGDVTLPLPPPSWRRSAARWRRWGRKSTFRGYPPELGYDFLRSAIAENDYKARGAEISPEEIVISDGAKSDTANIQEIFATDIRIAIPDPVYPVYVDTNVDGRPHRALPRRQVRQAHLPGFHRRQRLHSRPPKSRVDLIYLCFPNNPTGATIDRARLTAWVDYARAAKALILYDAAYESFIRDDSLPRSIFEIPGARECAIEFRSFSKTAGFTGHTVRLHRCAKDLRRI